MTDIIKNDCQGEEPDGKESIPVFLARTSKALYGNVESLDADDVCRLAELANRFFTLDCQAASHVESVICMRSAHFTGEPPYTGWKGLGKALREDYDDSDRLRSELEEAKELLKPFGSFTGKENYDEDQIDIIGERGVCGNYCVPDSHGFEVIWADEENGQTIHFTAGQFRRVRAFLNKEKIDEQK